LDKLSNYNKKEIKLNLPAGPLAMKIAFYIFDCNPTVCGCALEMDITGCPGTQSIEHYWIYTHGFSNIPLSTFVTIQSAIKGWNRKTILYFRENVHFREISRTPITIMLYLRQISKFFKIKIKVREYHNKLFAEACKFYCYILFPILITLQK